MPKVSVVVPNYNHADFLRRRIDSILSQTVQDFELILLDDFSTDDSGSILSSYGSDPRVRVEFNAANSGSTFKQWNKGVGVARGQYVWIAESDDYADARFLERLVGVLDSEPAAGFAYCRSWRVTDDGCVDGFADWYLEQVDPERWTTDFCVGGREEFAAYFARSCVVVNASAVVFRKEMYEQIGGADESLRVCGDWKVWAAMSLRGRVGFVREPLNYFQDHEQSVVHRNSRSGVAALESLKVSRWVLSQLALSDSALAKVYEAQAGSWVPAVMSLRLPVRLKREILTHVYAIDPHPVRRAFHPALLTIQRKFLKHWRSIGLAENGRPRGGSFKSQGNRVRETGVSQEQ